jgi:hypothetical protein
MRTRTKSFIGVIVCFSAVVLVEQLTTVNLYYARFTSSTHVEDKITAAAGDQVFTLQVEQPITRWIPLVKYGETVFFHNYRRSHGATAPLVERNAITRTRLLVIGLCSTQHYEQLARGPYESLHRDYLKQ